MLGFRCDGFDLFMIIIDIKESDLSVGKYIWLILREMFLESVSLMSVLFVNNFCFKYMYLIKVGVSWWYLFVLS